MTSPERTRLGMGKGIESLPSLLRRCGGMPCIAPLDSGAGQRDLPVELCDSPGSGSNSAGVIFCHKIEADLCAQRSNCGAQVEVGQDHRQTNEWEESSMRNQLSAVVVLAVVGLAIVASAQAPTPAPSASAAPVSVVVANPTYISIPLEIAVDGPAAEVWKRVGKFCDIGEWLRIPCTITSGDRKSTRL